MKKIFISFVALGALALSSCSSDPCKDKTSASTCSGHGTPTASGSSCNCSCESGYEGTDCSTLSTTKIVGNWSCLDNNSTVGTVGPYTASIAASSTVGSVVIGNFSNLNTTTSTTTATATIAGNNVTIPNQVLGTAYTVSGSGTYSTSTTGSAVISVNYTIVKVSTGTSYAYTGTWTK